MVLENLDEFEEEEGYRLQCMADIVKSGNLADARKMMAQMSDEDDSSEEVG